MSRPAGMRCPACDGTTNVHDSRCIGGVIRRRRRCDDVVGCGTRFTTEERFLGFNLVRERPLLTEPDIDHRITQEAHHFAASIPGAKA